MQIKRHIITQAVMTDENELIPIWDENIVFEKTEMYGNIITLKNKRPYNHLNLVECIFDIKTKKLEIGVELNYYPLEKDLPFKKGETVFFEKTNRVLVEATIIEVVYKEYDIMIKRGSKMDEYWKRRFNGFQIDSNQIYAIKQWKPYYLLDNGVLIKWEHELYHKHHG